MAACFWSYTKAVEIDSQTTLLKRRNRVLLVNTNMLCLRVVDNHVWVSEYALAIQENKILQLPNYDIEVPCVALELAGCFPRQLSKIMT